MQQLTKSRDSSENSSPSFGTGDPLPMANMAAMAGISALRSDWLVWEMLNYQPIKRHFIIVRTYHGGLPVAISNTVQPMLLREKRSLNQQNLLSPETETPSTSLLSRAAFNCILFAVPPPHQRIMFQCHWVSTRITRCRRLAKVLMKWSFGFLPTVPQNSLVEPQASAYSNNLR